MRRGDIVLEIISHLSAVSVKWKKKNAPGEVMEVKNTSFFPTGLSIRGRPQKTVAGLFKKSSESVRNRRWGITWKHLKSSVSKNYPFLCVSRRTD